MQNYSCNSETTKVINEFRYLKISNGSLVTAALTKLNI